MNTNKEVEELKDCPFCKAHELDVIKKMLPSRFYVECSYCYARGPENHSSAEKAIEAWNSRSNQGLVPDVYKVYEQIIEHGKHTDSGDLSWELKLAERICQTFGQPTRCTKPNCECGGDAIIPYIKGDFSEPIVGGHVLEQKPELQKLNYKKIEDHIKQTGELVDGIGQYARYIVKPAYLADDICRVFGGARRLSVKEIEELIIPHESHIRESAQAIYDAQKGIK